MKNRIKLISKKIKKKLKGFTLVELLAVIVILSVIMIIAIPSVLNTLQVSKRKTFEEYIAKTASLAQKQYLSDQSLDEIKDTCVLYNITTDLGLSTTGDYKGYVMAVKTDDGTKFYITLWDNDFMVSAIEYNDDISDYVKDYVENDNSLSIATLMDIANCSTYQYAPNGKDEPTDIGVSTETDRIAKKLKVGDFITYYPSVTSYKIPTEQTGCAETDECGDQTLNPSSTTVWIVLRINDDGTVEIFNKTEQISLYGLTAYKYYVKILNDASKQYINSDYALSARSIGYVNQVEVLDDSIINNIKENCIENVDNTITNKCNEIIGDSSKDGSDALYKSDLEYIRSNDWSYDKSYFASRISDNDLYYYGVGYATSTGCFIEYNGLYSRNNHYDSTDPTSRYATFKLISRKRSAYLIPVITLKASLKVQSGGGTYYNPYIIY